MDFKERYSKIFEKEAAIREEREQLEKDFGDWLGEQEDWKVFVLSHCRPSRFDLTADIIYEGIVPRVRNISEISSNGISFEVKIYDGLSNFGTWIGVYAKWEELRDMKNNAEVDKDAIRELIQKYQEGKEASERDLKSEIEQFDKEIKRLQTWLDR